MDVKRAAAEGRPYNDFGRPRRVAPTEIVGEPLRGLPHWAAAGGYSRRGAPPWAPIRELPNRASYGADVAHPEK